jgi:hypothetical protein
MTSDHKEEKTDEDTDSPIIDACKYNSKCTCMAIPIDNMDVFLKAGTNQGHLNMVKH